MANDVDQGPQAPPTLQAPAPLYVVGIGASAGGLGALRTLFGAMPRSPGFACVVVVHLSPTHESHLVELLQPYTQMRVQQVRSTVRLEANNVYVIPPNANLDTIDTHLRLSELEPRRIERAPIDHFLRTLARTHDGHAVAVVLTGSGSDGSLGVRQIKEHGGLTIAQDPVEAEFDSMPYSAIQTGAVDLVLELRDMPAAIGGFCSAQPRVPIRDGDDADPGQNEAVEEVCALLGARTGHEFKQFLRSTMLRRIGRRMRLRRVDTLDAYLAVLRARSDEADALANDLLLTVTEFFSDRELYERLEREVLPELFAAKTDPAARLRAWTVGCSTGEEAYSLAMLLIEEAEKREQSPAVQVFASDLTREVLEQARQGIYPHEIAATISAERLARFFVDEGDHLRVRKDVRDLVMFAEHNLLRDPPYAHLDLIVCRNLLAELRPEVRHAVLETFQYALEPSGRLVVGAQDEVDEPLLFESADGAGVLRPLDATPPALPLASYWRARDGHARSDPTAHPRPRTAAELAVIHYRMMGRHTPPSMLLNPEDTVAHYSTSAGRFVRMPAGEPTRDVHRLLRAPLPAVLRPLLSRARAESAAFASTPFTVETEAGPRRVVLHVDPPGPDSTGLTLVVIEELFGVGEAPGATAHSIPRLQVELEGVERRVRALIEARAKDAGEQASPDEPQGGPNEELRLLFDELEALSKHLQAANEARTIFDAEHESRLDELGQRSRDLHHLLESTGIATLFVDLELNIVRFTPQLGELFDIGAADVGRPLLDIPDGLAYDDLANDARRTLEHLTMVEREARSKAGRWYLVRMLPYRSQANRVEGVVLTLIDITDRKSAEQELLDANRRKDEFLALLAHELRNPLAPITAGIALLKNADGNRELIGQVTATIDRQTKQLVRLVDDLLEVSRVTSGRLRLRKGRVQLHDVVRDAIVSVRPLIERLRHELVLKMPQDPIELHADSARLTQVLANLLNNAARYTPEGGRLTIGAHREGGTAVVTVADNGVGIPRETLGRVFEMFYQADNPKLARGGGLGIGLTLAQSLVEMHGGTIMASSAGLGEGSEFEVRLPLADGQAVATEAAPAADEDRLGGHRVLIVDDNTDAAQTLGMLVETLGGNEVHVAFNGKDALRIAEERKPDIVLLDLKMPGMDGYEVARRLRRETWGRDVMLVALTGWALEEHKRRTHEAGFDGHLTKPADLSSLQSLLAARATSNAPPNAPPASR